jgi:O-acetyl-ADP-ribose deacetylase (regulator of RNase III)
LEASQGAPSKTIESSDPIELGWRERLMKIEYVSGDLIAGRETIIIQGCNAQGVMGRGLAKAVKERLPWAYDVYRKEFETNGLRLGTVVWAINISPKPLDENGRPRMGYDRSRIVGNAITQQHWEAAKAVDGRNVDYDAVRSTLKEIDAFVHLTQSGSPPFIEIPQIGEITRVGFPLIGAGLGGGEWDDISKIIENESQCFTPVVYRLPKR